MITLQWHDVWEQPGRMATVGIACDMPGCRACRRRCNIIIAAYNGPALEAEVQAIADELAAWAPTADQIFEPVPYPLGAWAAAGRIHHMCSGHAN